MGDVLGLDDRSVDGHDPVARLQACGSGRGAGRDSLDGGRRLPRRGHEETGEEDEREHDVGRRTGADRRDALPRRRSPVGGRAERVREVVEALLERRSGVRGQLLLGRELAQDAQRVARGVVVVGRQRAAQAGCRALERRGLPERPADSHVDVRRRRAVHSGDLHEAAERDRSDAVLDAVAGVASRSPAGTRCRTAAAACRARARRRSGPARARGSARRGRRSR